MDGISTAVVATTGWWAPLLRWYKGAEGVGDLAGPGVLQQRQPARCPRQVKPPIALQQGLRKAAQGSRLQAQPVSARAYASPCSGSTSLELQLDKMRHCAYISTADAGAGSAPGRPLWMAQLT